MNQLTRRQLWSLFSALLVTFALFPNRVEARRSTGIVVYSLTDGADIVVDGVKIGTVPMEALIPLTPGRHTLKITKPGYAERTEIVDIRSGQELEFELDLLPYAGVFKINTNAVDASLWLDGKPFGTLPFDGEIPMGDHTLKVVAPGFHPSQKTLTIEGGQMVTLRFDLEPAPIVAGGEGSILGKWWFWTAAGAVVIGGVTGVVLATGGGDSLPKADVSLNF
jgi:hypothetical protein